MALGVQAVERVDDRRDVDGVAHEVDFLARHSDGRVELVQVCADASGGETAARELRALAEAHRSRPDATARLLVATQAGLPPSVPAGVTAETAWAWILDVPRS